MEFDLDYARSVIQAEAGAIASMTPVVNGAFVKAARSAAQRASVPVSLLFDHASGIATIETAIRLGCQGVMADFSDLPFVPNAAATRAVG